MSQLHTDIDEESLGRGVGQTGQSGGHPFGYCDVCGKALIVTSGLNCAELRRIEADW